MKLRIADLTIILSAISIAGCGSPNPVSLSEYHEKRCVIQFNKDARNGLLDPRNLPQDCSLMVEVVANPASGREWERKQLVLENQRALRWRAFEMMLDQD